MNAVVVQPGAIEAADGEYVLLIVLTYPLFDGMKFAASGQWRKPSAPSR